MTGNPILLLLVLGPMAAGVVGYLIGRRNKALRDGFAIAVTAVEAAAALLLLLAGGEPTLSLPGVCGMGLTFQMDGFRGIFATVTAYMWMMTTFSPGNTWPTPATGTGTTCSCC
ncbi:MAG: hypothetical protein LUG58_04720 [Clostridiales bacterium]|nr:hypothetical protein [Clostridiales bacterium]